MSSPTTVQPDIRPRLLAAALGYAARGAAVFPLHVGRKRPPAWRDWEHRATTDPDRVREIWTRAPYNIGVACGPSGLVGVDLDVPKPGNPTPDRWRAAGVRDGAGVLAELARRAGQPWPVTMTVLTASGGRHLVYRAPAGVELRNAAGETVEWCIDIRADGGYLVGIGSEVAGRQYRLDSTAPATPAEIPGWLLTLLAASQKPTRGADSGAGDSAAARLRLTAGRNDPDDRPRRWATAVLAGEAADIAAMPPESGRNHALNGAAYKCGRLAGGGLLDVDDVRQILTTAGIDSGLDDPARGGERGASARTVESGLRAGLKSPRYDTPAGTAAHAASGGAA